MVDIEIEKTIYFSVVIPLYNKENCIIDCLNSVLSQSYENFEIIVVDDGSTDDSAQKVLSIKDERIRFYRKLNGGASSARNFGAFHSKYENIVFLDADDFWGVNHLENFVRAINSHPEENIYCNGWAWICDGVIVKPDHPACHSEVQPCIVDNYFKDICNYDPYVTSSSVMLRKSVFLQIGGFSEGVRMGEDQDLWIRLVLNHKKIVYTPQVTAFYRLEAENRACTIYTDNDLLSPIFTQWPKLAQDCGDPYFMRYLFLAHRRLIFSAILSGHNLTARKFIKVSSLSPMMRGVYLLFTFIPHVFYIGLRRINVARKAMQASFFG